MKVYVVMQNDGVDCVIKTEKNAEEYVEARIAAERALVASKQQLRRSHWRYHEFTVDKIGGARR